MKKIGSKNVYTFIVFVILIFASILRFYNFDSRWGLAYDQAHDALIGQYAVSHMQLPLLGPFSSAGAFQTGGEWYWIIMLGIILFPFTVMGPWIFITFVYVLFVFLIILFAKELVGKTFSIIVGLLTAVSTAQIAQSVSLTNQSPQAIFSLLSIWFSIKYLRKRNNIDLFLMGLFVSIGASIHLQGTALIALVIFTLIFSGMPQLKGLLFLFLGLLIPWIPVFVVDIENNFFNTRNMFNYYFYEQYKISLDVLGRRWVTFLGVFWPKMWSFVVGGSVIIGYVSGISLVLLSFYKIWKKTLPKEFLVLIASFILMVVVMRYTRTPLFESYIVFLHPFIFLLSGWMIYLLYKKQRIVGIMVLVLVMTFSLQRSIQEINYQGNSVNKPGLLLRENLIKEFPNTKFIVYDLKNKDVAMSYPLVLFLEEKNLNSDQGRKVGVALNKAGNQFTVIDLDHNSKQELKKQGWHPVTPEKVFLSTEKWYKHDMSD